MKEWQGENGDPGSVSPLHGKAQADNIPPAEKFGRGSLASSHAGTRLPIAAWPARTQGAPPRPAPGCPGAPECSMFLHAPFSKKWKKRRGPTWAARRVRSDNDFLRWHYPHQVEGRSVRFLSAVTAPLCFYEANYGTTGRACQGPAGLEIVKKTALRPCIVEERGV